MNNYVITHLHSDYSLIDSATKYEAYINIAKELGMKALAFTEHGNIFGWIGKKQKCDKAGIKYIHAQEFYLTKTLEEKVRDNYHIILIAKNWEGVKELNKLSSLAYNKKDGHFYYDPRITFEELKNTSDNILITTACLGGVLWKAVERFQDYEFEREFFNFLLENKHRCYLEIQPHNIIEQKSFNQKLYNLSKSSGIPLIAGTDTHALNQDLSDTRIILQLAKHISYPDEEKIDLTFKSYEELVNMFDAQGALPKDIYLEAIENTNRLADRVEEFKLDDSHKYPKLYDNPKEVFIEEIWKGIQEREFDKLDPIIKREYYDRINGELKVYATCKSEEYMLFLKKKIIEPCKERGIYVGYGRGSVNGSLIAYALGITEMDSIKWRLNFFRFMNPSRISLADIDLDLPPSRRAEVIQLLSETPEIYFSEIITFNTVAKKGSYREVGRALGTEYITPDEIDKICKDVEGIGKKQFLKNEEVWRKKYPKLFKYADLLEGVNVSVGSHPSGFLCSPIPLDENVGTFYSGESKHPVSQCNMKEVDSLNFVKVDLLGLDNIEIINKACELIGIERLTPDNMDFHDDDVWESIKESPLGIFQFEGDYAHEILTKVLNAVNIIREKAPEVTRIDLMSMTNGAIRPSGASYRDEMCQGIFSDNGHEALNKFLVDTMGYLIYQEQIMKFLVEFCGFTEAESDNVRRGFAKKTGTEQYLPAIEKGFYVTMKVKHDISKKEAEPILKGFLQVIEDASDYGFSTNHSTPYSCIGYACAYLRYYYPKEFIATMLNVNQDKFEKTSLIVDYAHMKDIKILPIKFGKSKSEYSVAEDGIYKGLKSIKFLNTQIADELYALSKNNYKSFLDLLIAIKDQTSIDARQLGILIKLNFFSDFGTNKKLLTFVDFFDNLYGKKQINKDKIDKLNLSLEIVQKYAEKETAKMFKDINIHGMLEEIWSLLEDNKLSIQEQLQAEYEFLGYIETQLDTKGDYIFITDINTKSTPKITAYDLRSGTQTKYKIYKKNYNSKPFSIGDIVRLKKVVEKGKPYLVDGRWVNSDTEMELILVEYVVLGGE